MEEEEFTKMEKAFTRGAKTSFQTTASLRSKTSDLGDISISDPITGNGNLGYAQELHRGFDGLMAFSFCFTSVAVVSSIAGLYVQGLSQGGPAMLIWSWIIGAALTVCACMSLAEICSSYPSSGSVYHWAGLLASPTYGPFAAFVTGWFNWLGNTAGDAFFAWAFAQAVDATLRAQGFDPLETWVLVVIASGALVAWALTNMMRIDHQGHVNNFASIFQIFTMVTVVGILLYGDFSSTEAANRATVDQVFFTYYNGTGFESVLYVCCIGTVFSAYCFTGYEASSHMAEETVDAETSVPKGIVYTGLATAGTGLVLLLGLLFVTASRVDQIVSEEWTITDIFMQVAGTKCGIFLSYVLTINMYFSGMSSLTTTARLTYAMARDGAFPGSLYFRSVTKENKIPLAAVYLTVIIDFFLIALNLLSFTAFEAIVSVATIGFQISYAIPIYLRITGYGKKHFIPSEYSLGRWGLLIGWISFIWLAFTSCLFLLPTKYPVTIDNISYAPMIVGGICILGGLYWFFNARYWFKGPLRLDDTL